MKQRIMFKMFEEYMKATYLLETAISEKAKKKAQRREKALKKIIMKGKKLERLHLNNAELDEINESIKQIVSDEFKNVE